jgi:hypothetical protein
MQDPHPWPVGTVCYGQNFRHTVKRNGMECVIVGPLKKRQGPREGTTEWVQDLSAYRVQWSDGSVRGVEPRNLRRRTQRQPDRRGFVATGLRKILDLFKERETL